MIALAIILTTLVVGLSMGLPLWITAVKREAAETAAEAWREEAEANAADARAVTEKRAKEAAMWSDLYYGATDELERTIGLLDSAESDLAYVRGVLAATQLERDRFQAAMNALLLNQVRAEVIELDAACGESNVVELRRGGA